MNAVDTNVLIYRLRSHQTCQGHSLDRPVDRGADPHDLTVAGDRELLRCLQTWREQNRIPATGPRRYVSAALRLSRLELPTPRVLDRALDLADRYSLSHWDSMLLGACIEAGVTTLYTEDMGAPTQYDSVQLVNPFI